MTIDTSPDAPIPSVLSKLHEIRQRMASHTDRDDERRVLEILAGSTAVELDQLLLQLDLPALLGDIDDRLIGPDNRTALLDLLTAERLGDLGIPARAALISALQRGRTGSRDEQALRRIWLGTRGADVTRLKNALDGRGGYRDLHQLFYHDIDDDSLREEILAHFAREAVSASGSLSGSGAVSVREVKILSDIDDTFYANWKDARYPKKTVYPGVLQFYAELDRGPGPVPGRAGDLTFVTARPGDRLGLVEDATIKALAERGQLTATVLAGSFTRLIGNRTIAEKKLENFLEYRRLYPEYDFVFVGDSGQGDIHFGQRMLEVAPEAVKAVFIHDVVATPDLARRELAASGVHLFDTYIGAALTALERGLLGPEGAARVAEAATAAFAAIPFPSQADREARRLEMARDVARLNEALPPSLRTGQP
ncbi:phosphatase domain-containing protein [Sorangium sp. So ce367]|uniref:phosphatase domain-containing protein n=1 Tax=Sorangium sp. So ce367 TaxID=3133305 RepID=UPI003F6463AC